MDAWLQNLCASMCPYVTESAAVLVKKVETTWEYLPLIKCIFSRSCVRVCVCVFFYPSALNIFADTQRSGLIVSCVSSKRHCVY